MASLGGFREDCGGGRVRGSGLVSDWEFDRLKGIKLCDTQKAFLALNYLRYIGLEMKSGERKRDSGARHPNGAREIPLWAACWHAWV